MGLVHPVGRTGGGYRLYDDEALRRLGLISRAKLLGLSLAETEEFIAVADSCCNEDQAELGAMVERKLEEAERRLHEVQALRDNLRDVLHGLGLREGQHRCQELLCTCQGAPAGDG